MCKNGVTWVFKLDEDFSWHSGLSLPDDLAFYDKKNVLRLTLTKSGTITVRKGYSWDGCTPKLCVFDILFGIPDGVVHTKTGKPKTYYASLVHDALYQFLPDGLPLTRRQADECFLKLMTASSFSLKGIYYLAVRIFGGLFAKAGRRIRKSQGRMVRQRKYLDSERSTGSRWMPGILAALDAQLG